MEDGFRERLQRALDARAFAEVAPLLDAAELEVRSSSSSAAAAAAVRPAACSGCPRPVCVCVKVQ